VFRAFVAQINYVIEMTPFGIGSLLWTSYSLPPTVPSYPLADVCGGNIVHRSVVINTYPFVFSKQLLHQRTWVEVRNG
jgi:hypothetical protein